MKNKIKISLLIKLMDEQSNENFFAFNLESGEFQASLSEDFIVEFGLDEDFGISSIDKAAKTQNDTLIRIPSKVEIQEFEIMKSFCYTIKDKGISNSILKSLYGSGAFKKFTALLAQNNLIDEWVRYRTQKFISIAEKWCIKNNLEFVE